MRRKIGFTALAITGISVVLAMAITSVSSYGANRIAFTCLGMIISVSWITAIVCLAGDVIRFIGKCFSQGANEGRGQDCGRVCPLCGKPLSSNARFCSECGCELTKDPE